MAPVLTCRHNSTDDPVAMEQRRKIVELQVATRRAEIEEFRAMDEPGEPLALGALILVPEDA